MSWVFVKNDFAYEMVGKYFINKSKLSRLKNGDVVIHTPQGITVVINDAAPDPEPFEPSTVSKGIPEPANQLNKLMEGYSAKPYLCSSGVPTISTGVTQYENGKPVRMTDPPVSEQRGRELYLFSANKVWATITDTPHWFDMTNNQRGTLFLFAYNLGWEYGDEGFDTLNGLLKDKNWAKVPEALKLYIKSAGKPNLGLYRRRLAEGYHWQGMGAQESYNKAWRVNRIGG